MSIFFCLPKEGLQIKKGREKDELVGFFRDLKYVQFTFRIIPFMLSQTLL